MVWVLAGFMGCGKSSIGRAVAAMAENLPGKLIFRDLDQEIEIREGRSIPEIFRTEGEEGFRKIEYDALMETICTYEEGTLLISLGGGTLTYPPSRELVRACTHCIYLRASIDTLVDNLSADSAPAGGTAGTASRPMLAGEGSLREKVTRLMKEREPIYEASAWQIIDIDGLDYPTIARQLLNSFGR